MEGVVGGQVSTSFYAAGPPDTFWSPLLSHFHIRNFVEVRRVGGSSVVTQQQLSFSHTRLHRRHCDLDK